MTSTVLFGLAAIAFLVAIALLVAWVKAPEKDGWIAPVLCACFAGGLAIVGMVLQ